MNVGDLREEIIRVTDGGYGDSKDVLIQVGLSEWLTVAYVSIAHVNGRFVLQLAAGERDGEPGAGR